MNPMSKNNTIENKRLAGYQNVLENREVLLVAALGWLGIVIGLIIGYYVALL